MEAASALEAPLKKVPRLDPRASSRLRRGMGGIGKTVTGAALVRDADVRDHFDQIVWLPLGQTPVMEKLQTSALEQLSGKQMDPTLSEEERHAVLREAFKGKRVLLALDDLWEEEHPAHLNFVDASCGSRVLISTRIRHLLADAFSVEIGKPSVEDSISILMEYKFWLKIDIIFVKCFWDLQMVK